MFEFKTAPKFLTEQAENRFLSSIAANTRKESLKYQCIALLQSDCGLRVSEAISLQIKNFNFPKKELITKCLKKKVDTFRVVPLTNRLISVCADYLKTFDKHDPEVYLFPSVNANSTRPYLSRKAVHKYFDRASDGTVHPHLLRHTCATKLIEGGASLITVKEILGHSKTGVTEIYTHATDERKKLAIAAIEKIPRWKRLLAKINPSVLQPKKVHVMPVSYGMTKFHIGRELEMSRLIDLTEKKVNVLILGQQGLGKSHLLDNLKLDKVLRIDDCREFRKTLAGMVLKLAGDDKEKVMELLEIDPSVVTTQSVKRLCELLISLTDKKEYTIILDSADNVTPTAIKALEDLRNHFHFIVSARQIKVTAATWLTNFEKLELKPLSRSEAVELIHRSSVDFADSIEDFEAYKNHIWLTTNGVPQFILEAVDRYRREGYVSAKVIENYKHTAGRKELDMSTVILLGLACLMIFRYVGGEIRGGEDSGAFKLIGGAALIFALFARQLFRAAKRRYV